MMRLRTIILLLVFYMVIVIAFDNRINILYPYFYFKDLLFYPVHAMTNNFSLSNEMENTEINNLKDEIEKLKNINNVSFTLMDYRRINATIISRNREYWYNTITINRGEKDNIKEDMAVIDSNGLIGRILKVYNHTSIVKLITTNDTKNKISAVIRDDKNIFGIINGYDYQNNYLLLIINENIKIKENLIVETTGMGGVFPKGIIIGKTVDTIKKDDMVTTIVRVIPSSDFNDMRYVSVLEREDYDN